MNVRRPGVAVAIAALAVTMAAIPLARAVADAIPAASPSEVRARVVFRSGTEPGTFRIMPRPRGPLALISIASRDGQDYTVVSSGTDFTDPTVWLRMRAGVLCWAERPTRATRAYTVRQAVVPFPAPRGAWAWSSIVLTGSGGPHPFTAPAAGDVLTTGQRIRSVVACVKPQFAPTANTPAVRDLQAVDAAPVASTPPPSTTMPTADLPPIPPPGTFAKPEDKVTICHATNSTSNPYNLQTVAQDSIDNPNGHGTHTGPLFPEPGWGDVIPPFEGYPGMNWPAGSLLLEDGCDLVVPPSPIDPPHIDIDPPDPVDPPGPIDPPIEVMPPIYLPPTPTPTASPSASPSATPTPTATPSATPTSTGTATPTATASPTLPPMASPSATPTPTATPTPSPSLTPSATPTSSATPSASSTPTTTAIPTSPPTSTTAPTGSSIPQPTPTLTPSPAPTASTPMLPERGDVDFTLTDGYRIFIVTRPARYLHALAAAHAPARCPSVITAGRIQLRAC